MEFEGVGVQDLPQRKKYELTAEIVEQLKKLLVENGLEPKIYKFINDGDTMVFRPLMFSDYTDIQAFVKSNEANGSAVSQDDIDRMICDKGIVWPGEVVNPSFWDLQKAGLQSTLAKQILARSGFIVNEIDQSAYMSVEPLITVSSGPKPSEDVVAELKKKHNWNLHLVLSEGEYYVVRPICRQEWRALTSAETADLDLLTAEKVTVWCKDFPIPVDFSSRAAGVARTIAEISMAMSGFNNRSVVEEL
jgi:hypothetical protein